MTLPKGSICNGIIKNNIDNAAFILLRSNPNDYHRIMIESAKSNNNNNFEKLYFSQKNIDYIQKQIVRQVYHKSKYRIQRQDDQDLLNVMKYVYQENMDKNLDQLNNITLNEIVPDIINDIIAYRHYLRRASGKMDFFDRPVNVSNKVNKVLPSSTKRFGY